MQPQNHQPNSQFDFIMDEGSKKKRGLGLPSLGLPRPVQIGLIVMIAVIILIIVGALLSGSKGSGSQPITSLMARAQEISRVSGLATQDSSDSNLKALSATVSAAMDSQENQLSTYLAGSGQKIDPKTLGIDQNSATDNLFQTAAQNNNLNSTYANYLTSNLNAYKSQLSGEYNKTGNAKLKAILNDAFASVQTIISSTSALQD